jgi:hypothetical protein
VSAGFREPVFLLLSEKTKHLPLKTSIKPSKGGPDKFVVDPFDKKKYQSKSADENAIYNTELTEKPEFEGGIELL